MRRSETKQLNPRVCNFQRKLPRNQRQNCLSTVACVSFPIHKLCTATYNFLCYLFTYRDEVLTEKTYIKQNTAADRPTFYITDITLQYTYTHSNFVKNYFWKKYSRKIIAFDHPKFMFPLNISIILYVILKLNSQ